MSWLHMESNSTRTVNAVRTACNVLDTLQRLNGAGVTELAKELNIAKSAVHAHLATLEECEYVVKEGTTYRLSLRYLDLGEYTKNQVGRYEVIKEEVDVLAQMTGEVVHFGIEEHGRVVYVTKSRGEKAVETASRVGKRTHLHSTALGKAILAEMADERIDRIIDTHGMPAQTQTTITDRKELKNQIEETRRQGYAIDDGENIKGVRCVAMPVMGANNEVLGALSTSGPSRRMKQNRIESKLVEMIAQSVNVIEVNSKFS
jgi:IclR family transcriptional regulator, KDG regulon repressor